MASVTLDVVVGMCKDCASLCTLRTKRFVEDLGLQPYGSEWKYQQEAERRREEMYSKCTTDCTYVQLACPSEARVKRFLLGHKATQDSIAELKAKAQEAATTTATSSASAAAPPPPGARQPSDAAGEKNSSAWYRWGFGSPFKGKEGTAAAATSSSASGVPPPLAASSSATSSASSTTATSTLTSGKEGSNAGGGGGSAQPPHASPVAFVPSGDDVTLEEIGRCERSAERFVSTLFVIASKPTKVMFEDRVDRPKDKLLGLGAMSAEAANPSDASATSGYGGGVIPPPAPLPG